MTSSKSEHKHSKVLSYHKVLLLYCIIYVMFVISGHTNSRYDGQADLSQGVRFKRSYINYSKFRLTTTSSLPLVTTGTVSFTPFCWADKSYKSTSTSFKHSAKYQKSSFCRLANYYLYKRVFNFWAQESTVGVDEHAYLTRLLKQIRSSNSDWTEW